MVQDHTWVDQLPGHVLKAADLFLLWRMNHHVGGAQDAEQAAQLPVQVQPLRQEVGRQNRTAMRCAWLVTMTPQNHLHTKRGV